MHKKDNNDQINAAITCKEHWEKTVFDFMLPKNVNASRKTFSSRSIDFYYFIFSYLTFFVSEIIDYSFCI